MTIADETTTAFILRSVDYRDSDKIITFFSRDLGKITAIAKGARSSRKRFGGALEHFSILEILLANTKMGGRMYRLAESTVIRSNAEIAGDLTHMSAGSLILELVRELVQESDPDPRLFDLVTEALGTLSKTNESNSDTVALCVLLRILALSGFAVGVNKCIVCNRKVPVGKRVLFDIGRGGVVCRDCGGGPINLSAGAANAFMVLAQSTIQEAAILDFNHKYLVEVEETLDDFITFHLGRPLKTTTFKAQINKYKKQS